MLLQSDQWRRVGRLNIEGAAQADLSVHGGVDKAVYVYPAERYDYWREELHQRGRRSYEQMAIWIRAILGLYRRTIGMATKAASLRGRQRRFGTGGWAYLTRDPRRHTVDLFVFGTRLPASIVWSSMLANGFTVEQAALEWDIPVEAVEECIKFSEQHEAELNAEAAEEWRGAIERGIRLEPSPDA